MKFNFTPTPVLGKFMSSNARVRIVRGPVGSGKSTAMVMELLRRAVQQAPDSDGIRRTKGAIIRNTLNQLETTVLVTVMKALRHIAVYRPSSHTIQIRAPGVESDWLLMPLDRPENVQRLLSLELTFAWMSELRELDPELVQDILGRLGRYPSDLGGGAPVSWYGLIGETNSFSEDSPWYPLLEEKLPPGWEYFVQPGARDPNAERPPGLPPRYYEDLVESNTEEWVEQYVDNKITASLAGEAVFRASFKHDWHIAQQPLLPIPGYMCVIGMDFGRSPAAVLTQIDPKGRLLVLAEATSENMGIEKFCATVLHPILAQSEFQRIPYGVVGDPSGIAKSQIGEESVFDALKRLGFSAQPAMTNNLAPRLRAVEKWLLQQRDGGPAILISPTCKVLCQSLRSKYRYSKKKDGQLAPEPDKTHPWSDVTDALQYAVLGHSDKIMARFMRPRRDTSRSKTPSAAGWT